MQRWPRDDRFERLISHASLSLALSISSLAAAVRPPASFALLILPICRAPLVPPDYLTT